MRLRVRAEVYIVLASAFFLTDPRWVLGWLVAASVHELCHYATLNICAVQVFGVEVGVWGAQMETGPVSNSKELICALAGPAGGLISILFARVFPQMAVCAFVQSAFNLLPVYPMDGGRVLRCILRILLPGSYSRAQCLAEAAALTLLIATGVYCAAVLKVGCIPAVAAVLIALKSCFRRLIEGKKAARRTAFIRIK